jgi:hypothetical protein
MEIGAFTTAESATAERRMSRYHQCLSAANRSPAMSSITRFMCSVAITAIGHLWG